MSPECPWGGGMALWLTLEHPARVRRLVPVSAYGLMQRMPLHGLTAPLVRAGVLRLLYAGASTRGLARLGLGSSYGDRQRVTDVAVDELMAVARDQRQRRSFDGFLAAELTPTGLRSDLTPRLGEISQPTLLIHGSADRLVPVRHARRAAALIPDARLLVLDTGHWPMRERPDLFNPVLARFLGAAQPGAVVTNT